MREAAKPSTPPTPPMKWYENNIRPPNFQPGKVKKIYGIDMQLTKKPVQKPMPHASATRTSEGVWSGVREAVTSATE